ncbi:MAG: InlB B-repeat-containing protein, partial [Clostridia bacterium]|nr:InlB B-repeat-containing protein [Clostridia bacterium]
MKRILTIMLSVLLVINLAVPFAFAEDRNTQEIVKWSFNEKPSKAALSVSADEKCSLSFSDGIWTCWNGDGSGKPFFGDGKALVSERDKNDTYNNVVISPPVTLPNGSAKITFNAVGEDEYFSLKVVEVREGKDNTTVLNDISSEGFIPSYIYNAKEILNTTAGSSNGGNTFRVDIPSEFLGKRVCFAFSHHPYGYYESGSLSVDNVAVTGAGEVLTKTVTFQVPEGAKCKEKFMETGTDGKLRYLPEPTLEGYTFVGWELDSETVTVDYIYESDAILTAKWDKKRGKTYRITIESATIAAATDAVGERITAAEPGETVYLHTDGTSNSGVYFHGWEVVKGNTELVDARSADPHFTMPQEDVTVKAVYNSEKPAISVIFDAGIGTVEGQKSVTLTTDKNGKLPYIPSAVSDSELIFAGWTKRYNTTADTNLEADNLTADTVIEAPYNNEITYIAVWSESPDGLENYAYWKNPGKYGFVFSKKFDFIKGRRYFIYLIKDSRKVPESLNDTRAMKLIEVTAREDDYDFTDEILIHGDGTYYAGVLAVNNKDGKSFYQLRGEESVAFTYRESDYLNFESQSVGNGSLVDLREGETYNLSYSAVSLPAPFTERGWSMKPFIAVRKTGENGSLSEWDYTAFDNTGKASGNSWTRKISIKERGHYEIKYGVTLVKNGGRIIYMSKNDTGLLTSSFDVSVLGKDDRIDRILTGLRIGNYTFDSSELAGLAGRSSDDGSWSVKFNKGTTQDTVNITLNGYIGGPIVLEREDQSSRLAVNVTA